MVPGGTAAELACDALAGCYGLTATGRPVPLPYGQSAVSLAVPTDGGRVVVKLYRTGTDLAAERDAIALSEFAAAGGVPTAALVRPRGGGVLGRHDDTPLSVWRYVDGDSVTATGLDPARMAAVGTVLGSLHHRLAAHPAAPPVVVPARTLDLCDIPRAAARVDELLASLDGRPAAGAFARWAAEALRWRRGILPRIATLFAGLPRLTRQVVHGDLAAPNVLFRGDRVAALIDFRPPVPNAAAYDVTRIGFDPRTVRRPDWLAGLAALVSAYRVRHPGSRADDLLAGARFWVCHTAASSYPIGHLLAGTAPRSRQLVDYAQDRHAALVAVLDRLDEVEAVL